jgi:hypothetical protein
MIDHEFIAALAALAVLWTAAQAGAYVRRTRRKLEQDDLADMGIVVTASLTLLALIIGFTFSMAVTRYNQRKDCESAEANAIRTEYLRASLLPAEEGARLRELLKSYVSRRVQFYLVEERAELQRIELATAQTLTDLWSLLQPRAATQPTPIMAMPVAGVTEIWNTEGSTRAAWLNRIPIAGWILMGSVAICCNFLVGFTSRRHEAGRKRLLVLPVLLSLSFLLIADVDNPRKGAIIVHPQNLERLAVSLQGSRAAAKGLRQRKGVDMNETHFAYIHTVFAQRGRVVSLVLSIWLALALSSSCSRREKPAGSEAKEPAATPPTGAMNLSGVLKLRESGAMRRWSSSSSKRTIGRSRPTRRDSFSNSKRI